MGWGMPELERSVTEPREIEQWNPRERGPDRSLVGRCVGSYRITRLLGEGGVGAVYLGEHPVVQSRVAIKVLHDDLARSAEMVHRFVTEARAANLIPSPHVVRVSDFGRLDCGREYAVMEYLEGRSLGDILAEEGTLSVRRAIELLRQTADGMAVAHAHGIIHRDLKPENLFVQQPPGRGEFVRILDFGIAKLTQVARDARVTAAGVFVGTPLYCSPEQMAGQDVGPASDIYSLGAVAFELVTGRPLFDGDGMDVLVQKAKGTSDALHALSGTVPAELAQLIRAMVDLRPAQRPASMAVVAERLSRIARELELHGTAGLKVARRAWRLDDPRARRALAGGLALLLTAGGLALWLNRGAEPVQESRPAPSGTAADETPAAEAPRSAVQPNAQPPEVAAQPAVSPESTVPGSATTPSAPARPTPATEPPAAPAAPVRAGRPASSPAQRKDRAGARPARKAPDRQLGTLVDPFAQ
jgi:tRNA A-37 threonylcarbamoyl transferase component Bud32